MIYKSVFMNNKSKIKAIYLGSVVAQMMYEGGIPSVIPRRRIYYSEIAISRYSLWLIQFIR